MMKTEKKLNNKGLSLVEIIIAMVILTVAVVPTLRTFSSATGFNSKARRNMQAITVAEAVMESFKGYSVEDLCKQFNVNGVTYCTCGKTTASCSKYGHDAAHKLAIYKLPHDSLSVTATGAILDSDNKLNEAADDFVFTISGCQQENRKYDVVVNVKKVAAYDDKVLKTELMNAYKDAVIQLDESGITDIYTLMETTAKDYLTNNFSAPTGYVADSMAFDSLQINSLDRVITVTAAPGTVTYSIQYTYNMDIVYKYTKTDGATPVPNLTPQVNNTDFAGVTGTVDVDFGGGVTTQTVFDNSSTGVDLEQIYLYYYPLYADTTKKINAATDKICFLNYSGTKLGIHVARQKSTAYNSTQYSIFEHAYKLTVDGSGNDMTLEHNNLDKSLADPTQNITQCDFTGNFSNGGGGVIHTKPIEEATQDKKALLYTVDISVTDASDPTIQASFSGTKND